MLYQHPLASQSKNKKFLYKIKIVYHLRRTKQQDWIERFVMMRLLFKILLYIFWSIDHIHFVTVVFFWQEKYIVANKWGNEIFCRKKLKEIKKKISFYAKNEDDSKKVFWKPSWLKFLVDSHFYFKENPLRQLSHVALNNRL